VNKRKLLSAGLGSSLVVVLACFLFLTHERPSGVAPPLGLPVQGSGIPVNHANAAAPTNPESFTPSPRDMAPAVSETLDEIAALGREVEELHVQAADLAASQARTEALIETLGHEVGVPVMRVPTYEEHSAHLREFSAEVEKQRDAVRDSRRKALEVARELGLPESAVNLIFSEKPEGRQHGRDYSAFTKAKTAFIHNTKILQAAEKRFRQSQEIRSLPADGEEH
jgi:hypothetical protein